MIMEIKSGWSCTFLFVVLLIVWSFVSDVIHGSLDASNLTRRRHQWNSTCPACSNNCVTLECSRRFVFGKLVTPFDFFLDTSWTDTDTSFPRTCLEVHQIRSFVASFWTKLHQKMHNPNINLDSPGYSWGNPWKELWNTTEHWSWKELP